MFSPYLRECKISPRPHSFCPGFRFDVVQRNPWHSPSYDILGEHDDDNPVGGDGKLSELWELATFKLEEVVVLVDFKGVENRTEDRYTPQTLDNATCVKVEEQVSGGFL